MKKLISSSLAIIALALTASAAPLLDEPFTYADGSIITNSAYAWTNHSGTLGQTKIVSGRVELRAGNGTLPTQTEDIFRLIPGGPFTTPTNLYASIVVNFSEAPANGSEYFAMFKDSTTGGFRCRVFVATNNAAVGKIRFGIRNFSAGTVQYLAQDYDLNTDIKIVLRYITSVGPGGTNCTLWVNPTSEASPTVVTANDTTANTYNGTYSFGLRQANSIGIVQIDDLKVGLQFSDVQTIGGPPTIIGLVSTNIAANSNTGPMPFTVSDVETPVSNLTVIATSDNATLVPNTSANLTFGGPFTNSTLTVTPAAGEQGTATIAVEVTDNTGDKATNTFTVTVGAPSISSVANQVTPNGTPHAVNFTVADAETAAGSLVVTATSSDQAVLPDANIGVFNPGTSSRTVNMTNAAPGFTVVTVTVSDGTFSIPTTFTLTAAPDNGILLAEDFGYADGSIITNSLASAPHNWTLHSGTTGQTQVASSKLLLVNNASEDINRWFTNNPVLNTSGQMIYSRIVLRLSSLPTASEYFTHVYGFSGAFRARIFTTTNGAAAGKYRLNITSAGFNTNSFPQDLVTNASYVVISRYNTATAEASLWVDPVSEASTSLAAIDVSTSITAYGIAFRQQSGIGNMSIDDLLVGSTFSQVMLTVISSDANLSALTLSSGTLAPAFDASTTSYTATVANAVTSITVTPTAADGTSTIEARVNGGSYASVNSGSPSGALALNVGANTVDVKVTAEDATIKTYTVTVTRALSANADLSALALSAGTLAPTFASGTVSYTASVPNATASMTVTPTSAHAGATIEVRVNGGSYSGVTSGSPSGSLALNVGANTVDVKVTAEDTTTIKTYTVTVTRAAAPPTPENINFATTGNNLILSWSQANWTGLMTGTNVTGVTNAVIGATSPYTNSLSAPETYFRLYFAIP